MGKLWNGILAGGLVGLLLVSSAVLGQSTITVDVSLHKVGNDTLEVRLRPTQNFNQVVSNVVFTIRWRTSSNSSLGNVIQTFPENVYIPMTKSGNEEDDSGFRYQIFAGFGFFQMSQFGASWTAGQEVVLMRVPVISGASDTFQIINDAWTGDLNNNGDFYVSLNGTDRTGIIYHPAVFICNLNLSETHTDVSCNGGTDGAVDLTVTGATPPVSYNWPNSATTEDLLNIGAGSYGVTVSDGAGCSGTLSVTITEPNVLAASSTASDVSCPSGFDGTITTSVSGGTPGYSFSWSNGDTTQNLTGLPAGSYHLTVIDANNCTATLSDTVEEPPAFGLAVQTTGACEGRQNGAIDLTVSGGSPPYSYNWSNGDTLEDLGNIAAGLYGLTVTDVHSCDTAITVQVGTLPNLSTTIDTSICQGDTLVLGGRNFTDAGAHLDTFIAANGCDSVVTVNLTVLPNAFTAIADTICDGDTLMVGGRYFSTAGTHIDTFVSGNGCDSVVTVNLTVLPNAFTTIADTICDGDTLMVGSRHFSTAGTHIDTFVSGNGCDSVVTINLTVLPNAFTAIADTICDGDTLMVGGRHFSTAGTHIDTFVSGNGCDSVVSVNLTVIQLTLSIQVTDISCLTGPGLIDLTVTGGVTPYAYAWSSGATTEDLTVTQKGQYAVTVTDQANCIAMDSEAVAIPTVDSLYAGPIGPNAARLNWDTVPGAHHYVIRGRKLGDTVFTSIIIPPNRPNYKDVHNLQYQTSYEWQIIAYCDSARTFHSAWSKLDTFMTDCMPPDTAWASDVTDSSVVINWTTAPGALGYQITGRQVGKPWWNSFLIAPHVTSKQFSDLKAATAYEWTIRTACGQSIHKRSVYLPLDTFTTLSGTPKRSEVMDEPARQREARMRIVPNPFEREARIFLPDPEMEVERIRLLDITGKTVRDERTFEQRPLVIERGELPNGLYFLELIGKRIYRSKVVIE